MVVLWLSCCASGEGMVGVVLVFTVESLFVAGFVGARGVLFQKCSRDDHKMTLGGLHGCGMVHSSGV